jgi:hypothetical protein
MNGEKGNPPSLAKDQSWRDDVAISLMTAEVNTMIIIDVIAFVAA